MIGIDVGVDVGVAGGLLVVITAAVALGVGQRRRRAREMYETEEAVPGYASSGGEQDDQAGRTRAEPPGWTADSPPDSAAVAPPRAAPEAPRRKRLIIPPSAPPPPSPAPPMAPPGAPPKAKHRIFGLPIPPPPEPSPAAPAAVQSKEPSHDEARWLRLQFVEPETGAAVPAHAVQVNEVLGLRVSVGPELAGALTGDEEFPAQLLPEADLTLEVVVSSTDFALGYGLNPGECSVTRGEVILRSSDRTSGEFVVTLTAPGEPGSARARVSTYYRDALVQSVLLAASIGAPDHEFVLAVTSDYTATRSLVDLANVQEEGRLAILTNDNGAGEHQIVIRRPSGTDGDPETFTLSTDAVAVLLEELRDELARVSPTKLPATSKDLTDSLRRLAPIGARLYSSLFTEAPSTLLHLKNADPGSMIVQVVRPRSSTFTYPWALLYGIYLDRQINVNNLAVCPVINDLGAGSVSLPASGGRCPRESDVSHLENILCPFGFWGLRYQIELPASSAHLQPVLIAGDPTVLTMGVTDRDVNEKSLDAHLGRLEKLWKDQFPDLAPSQCGRKKALLEAMASDQPLVYFLCHGDKDGAEVTLGLSGNDRLFVEDIVDLVLRSSSGGQRQLWQRCAPLIFLNACGSAIVEPSTLVSYVDAFVSAASATGVIGTETRVNQEVAQRVAELVISSMLADGLSLGEALLHVRTLLLSELSLVGLFYTPYSWANVRFGRAQEALLSA